MSLSPEKLFDIYTPGADSLFQSRNPGMYWLLFLKQPVQNLDLSGALTAMLWRKYIRTMGRLLCFSPAEFHRLDGIGDISADRVAEVLAGFGMRFSSHEPERRGWMRVSVEQNRPLTLSLSPSLFAEWTFTELLTTSCDRAYAYWEPQRPEPTIGSLNSFDLVEIRARLIACYSNQPDGAIASAAIKLRAALLFSQPVE